MGSHNKWGLRGYSKDLEFYSMMRSHEKILSKSDRRPDRRLLQQSRREAMLYGPGWQKRRW